MSKARSRSGSRIRIRGLVQGVGFRPTVWQLAHQSGLHGTVRNDGEGVLIHLATDEETAHQFVDALKKALPPLARLDRVEIKACTDPIAHDGFHIIESAVGNVSTAIVPDAATCPDCLKDVLSPDNRRHGYAFTNCTHCGPRLTITRQLPYDRTNTSMDAFPMCPECGEEYRNISDRRFHAQPNACPVCGPTLSMTDQSGQVWDDLNSDQIISKACKLLVQGKILAIKGLGGFHIACDATNEDTIARLRDAKRRPAKPLAVMVPSAEFAERYAKLSTSEKEALTSRAAPIVLLDRLADCPERKLATNLAPGMDRIGIMLPYTPLHHLLLRQFDGPLVMTSGNLSGEPQITENDEAIAKLGNIVDAFILHNRDIVNRVDDSVLQVVADQPAILRRARGYAPESLVLPKGFETAPPVLAMGSYFKATFCQLDHGQAVMSHHIGDLDGQKVQQDYQKAIELYGQMRQFTPATIAVDLHPDYASTRLGEAFAQELGCDLIHVQHHHAHIAACMAEHHLPMDCDPVLGIALDGLGLGDDGQIWGGEIMLADYHRFERLASFKPVPLIGGDKANREPWRTLFAQLHSSLGWQTCLESFGKIEAIEWFGDRQTPLLESVMQNPAFSPASSSAGRLFDAVAASLGLYQGGMSYEGEAAICLQNWAEQFTSSTNETIPQIYPFEIISGLVEQIDMAPMWPELLADLGSNRSKSFIAYRFHRTIAHIVAMMAARHARKCKIRKIVLTGGVFQNRLLLALVRENMRYVDLDVMIPHSFPANDGGVSLGQAAIAAARNA